MTDGACMLQESVRLGRHGEKHARVRKKDVAKQTVGSRHLEVWGDLRKRPIVVGDGREQAQVVPEREQQAPCVALRCAASRPWNDTEQRPAPWMRLLEWTGMLGVRTYKKRHKHTYGTVQYVHTLSPLISVCAV
jgi:hypothetical protein